MQKILLEDNKNESGVPEQSKSSKRNAVIAGVSVASGAILLATLMIGGTLLATNGSGMYSSSQGPLTSQKVVETHLNGEHNLPRDL